MLVCSIIDRVTSFIWTPVCFMRPYIPLLSIYFSNRANPLIAAHRYPNQCIRSYCIFAEGDCACNEDDNDDENNDVKINNTRPALGIPVISNCVPVIGQAYMVLCVWVLFYALWTIVARGVSETGPIFKPMLFLFLRNICATILLVIFVLLSEGCRIRSLRPRKRDARLTLALGATIWINKFFTIYGLRFTTATNAALLEACIPVYTTIIGLIIGSEFFGNGYNRVKKVLGLTFCTGGAIFVILASDRAQDHLNMSQSRHLYGNFLFWIATVFIFCVFV